MRRTRRQCHGDREGHAPESRHHVASESIEFEFLDRGVVVCVGECCCCCCGGGIFLCSGGRERRSVVMVWIFARGRERVSRGWECALPVCLVAGMAMSWLFWCG